MLAAMALAGASFAQPYFVRGDFNGWGTSHQMNHVDGNHYQLTLTDLTPGAQVMKIAGAEWGSGSEAPGPGGNLTVFVDADGSFTLDFWDESSWADGWLPNGPRVGYTGAEDHGWEIMGSFNGWSSPFAMTSNGSYLKALLDVDPGTYEFKFRKTDDWGVSIGFDFRSNDGNISFTQPDGMDQLLVSLDVANGRYNVEAVPEPGTMVALAAGIAALASRRRRKA